MTKDEALKAYKCELNEKLDGSVLTNALELVTYLAANDIYPDPNMFNAFRYAGEMIFFIGLGKSLSIYSGNYDLNYDDEAVQKDDALEMFVHKATNRCVQHKGCLESPGLRRVAFGTVYENRCRSTFCFKLPPLKNLALIKKVAEMRKNAIDAMPELKRALRSDINEMLNYYMKSCAVDFADYLYENYELQHAGDKVWRVQKNEKILCMILLEKDKWTITLYNGDKFETPKFDEYDKIKKLLEVSV